MKKKYFGTDGIRGTVNKGDINGEKFFKFGLAAGIYFKDVGSRKGLSIAESDVEYTASTDTIKTVYKNKAITNVRKLITEGYIKINRESQNVSVIVEKANL